MLHCRSAVTIQAYEDEEKAEEPRRLINVTVPSLRETSSRQSVPVDQAENPNYEYACVGAQEGLDQGCIVTGEHDGVVDEHPVQLVYTTIQPVCGSASNSPVSASGPEVRQASAASPQVHQPAELRQPQRALQTAEATPTDSDRFPTRTPVAASQLGYISRAGFAVAAAADPIIQQTNIQSGERNVNPPKVAASDAQSGAKNANGLLCESGTVATTSVEGPPPQCGTGTKAAVNCEQILASSQAADPADLPAALSASACDTNLAMLRPPPDTVHLVAGIADASMSSPSGASSSLIGEKTSSSAMNDEVTLLETALTNEEASPSHADQGPIPTVDDPVGGAIAILNSNLVAGHNSDHLAAPKTLIDQRASQENVQSVSPFQPVQASPIVPPPSGVSFSSKPSEVRDGTSLGGSVDSVGLSPLTSLDLSGSFFRDVEAKTALSPSLLTSPDSASAAESVSLETMPRAMVTSSLESEPLRTATVSSQLEHIPKASCEPEAIPVVGGTSELLSGTRFSQESTGSKTVDGPVAIQDAVQEIPRDFVDRNTSETNPVTTASMLEEDEQQNPSIMAVSGSQQRESVKASSAVESDDKPSIQAATEAESASGPISVAEPSATATASNEVRAPHLGELSRQI